MSLFSRPPFQDTLSCFCIRLYFQGRSTAQKLLFFAEKAEDIAKTDPESAEVMQKAAKNLRDWASKPYLNLLSNVFNTAINALLSDPTGASLYTVFFFVFLF